MFVRLTGDYASKGEYYKCSDCGSMFSNMSSYPLWVKAKVLKTHLDRCEMAEKRTQGRVERVDRLRACDQSQN